MYLLQFENKTIGDLLTDFFNKVSNAFNDGLEKGQYGGRKNFFSYSYLIYKMVTTIIHQKMLSDETESILVDILSRIQILKSIEKKMAMDNMWDITWLSIDW